MTRPSATSRRAQPRGPHSAHGTIAEPHRRTRAAHSSELAEDYVKLIANLIEANGEARVVDLARDLGVTHVSVVKTVARLRAAGLVSTRPYRAIFLTDRGRKLAEKVKKRHNLVVKFLLALGVSTRVAAADAEGLEHHVGRETRDAFERFVRRQSQESAK